jgi:hypothetical protein
MPENPMKMVKIRQAYPRPVISDIPAAVYSALKKCPLNVKQGASIAIAAGSRGIANHDGIIIAVASYFKEMGARPFIIPAMGSHGGATAAGQEAVLAGYGITEQTIGVPVVSSMDVVEIPCPNHPCRVFMDRHAWESDGVVLVNRIKPHTDFHGLYESGLIKMSVIGLGKQAQASEIHRFGVPGLREYIPLTASKVAATGKVLLGIGIVENAYDETAVIEALLPHEIFRREPHLLQLARDNMPALPVADIDVLIVDRIGKDISGTGMDPWIIGRMMIRGEPEPDRPCIRSIVACDLSDGSHGNALGVGFADVISRKLYDKIDSTITSANAVTSTFYERVKVPLTVASDREAFRCALSSCGGIADEQARVVRIRDTLHCTEAYVSMPVYEGIRSNKAITVIDEVSNGWEMFAADGNLSPF